MKNFTLTIVLVLSQMLLFAQCPQGDITIFSSQTQIDEFPINYPNCTAIPGGVTITGNIMNLYGLNAITSIGGTLNFLYNVALNNLMGLENLTTIGGDLVIIENYTLTNLTGLNNVTSIEGDLAIYNHSFLSNVAGLSGLTYVGGVLGIGQNNASLPAVSVTL